VRAEFVKQVTAIKLDLTAADAKELMNALQSMDIGKEAGFGQ
jgi:hypothetical protein